MCFITESLKMEKSIYLPTVINRTSHGFPIEMIKLSVTLQSTLKMICGSVNAIGAGSWLPFDVFLL